MRQSIVHRIFWGLLLVGIGVVFLLVFTGAVTVDIGSLFGTFWPVILIMVGLQGILIQPRGGLWWNPIVLLIGVYFLGRNLGWFEWEIGDMMRIIGPAILILFGINVIFHGGGRSRRRHRRGYREDGWSPVRPPVPPEPPQGSEFGPSSSDYAPPPPPPPPQSFGDDGRYGPGADQASDTDGRPASAGTSINLGKKPAPEGEFGPRTTGSAAGPSFQEMPGPDPRGRDEHYWKHRYWKEHHVPPWQNASGDGRESHSKFIGDMVFGQDYFELRPMSISSFIGDTKLDLTRAHISPGETRIYVSSFIGDVKVFVPDDYSVGVRVVSSSLIGDVKVMDQKRGGLFNQMNVETPRFADASRQIVLIVSTFIGDVRVQKVG